MSWMHSRGLIYQKTNETNLAAKLDKKEICCYLGVDLTANSMHIGHLLPLRIMSILSQHGNKCIFLFGRGTTMIGDPSMRQKERPMLSQNEIHDNMLQIKPQVERLVKNVVHEDNADWLLETNLIDFLREVGSKFSVNQMVNLETFKRRLEENNPLSFLEFTYPILQSYDFYKLYQKHECNLQIGGSDQWGNIINGVNFIRKSNSQEVYGITVPLLLRGGKKMGKSTGGAIWLDDSQTSVFDFWQFWRNLPDEDVKNYMLKFTDLDVEIIDDKITSNINDAKKHLADHMTQWVHGEEKAKEAKIKSISIFENKEMNLVDTFNITEEIKLTKLLVEIKFATSVSDAKRKINSNAISLDTVLCSDNEMKINKDNYKKEFILQCGKKHKIKIIQNY